MRILLTILLLLTTCNVAYGSRVLINGAAVKPGEYPEVVRIRSCRSDGGGCASCSASVVGPRVVLTAGHCLAEDGGQIEYMLGQQRHVAKCTAHPLYPNIEDMDMALCVSDRPMEVKFAHVSKAGPAVRDRVTLIGYGCTQEGGGGGNDGILRVGESTVVRLPQSDPVDNWFYTQSEAALCFGDSGGPSYKNLISPETQTHYVLGVNSRGNIKDLSLLTATYLSKSFEFMSQFEAENRVTICGVSSDCGDTQPEPEPLPPEDIPGECRRIQRRVERYERRVERYQRRIERSKDRLNQCIEENTEFILPFLES